MHDFFEHFACIAAVGREMHDFFVHLACNAAGRRELHDFFVHLVTAKKADYQNR